MPATTAAPPETGIREAPLAGPALAITGGLVLLFVSVLAFSPSQPLFAPTVPIGERVAVFVLVGPGLGPVIIGLGALCYRLPRYRVLLGTAIVPFAILGVFSGSAGALFVGPVLGVIGGALSVGFESRGYDAATLDESGLPGRIRRSYAIFPAAFVAIGLMMAVIAPTFIAVACPPPEWPCLPTGACPAVAQSCDGPTIWMVLLGSGIVTTPLAFRLRALRWGLPIPA